MTLNPRPGPGFPLRARMAALLVALTGIALTGAAASAGTIAQADASSAESHSIAGAIAAAPQLSFTDDGLPVVIYRDLDPFEELVDREGQRIPDQLGSRARVLVCADPTCDAPPRTDTRLPVDDEHVVGAVIGRDVVIAAGTNPAIMSICDVETCLGGLVAVNLTGLTGDGAVVHDLVRGQDRSHHVLLGDGTTTWLVRCTLASCLPEDIRSFTGGAQSMAISEAGAPLVALADGQGSIAVLACSTSTCLGDSPTPNVTAGNQALVTEGEDGTIVAALQDDGSVSMFHCDGAACADHDPATTVTITPDAGSAFTELMALDVLRSRAPVLALISTDGAGSQSSLIVAVDACARAGCTGDAQPSVVTSHRDAARVDLAVRPTGYLHTVADRANALRENGEPAYEDMTIEFTSCDVECQCKLSTCIPLTAAEVCLTESDPDEIAWLADLDLNVVDMQFPTEPAAERNLILGTDMAETFLVGPSDVVCGGGGDDTITFRGGPGPAPELPTSGSWAQAFGGAGDDTIDMSALTIGHARGDAGDDTIIGSPGDDDLDGGSGNDTVVGITGDDTMRGGPGDDTMWGGPGSDTMRGQGGADRLRGGPGDDTISGAGIGDPGDLTDTDDIGGGSGSDFLFGNAGADIVRGGTGDDVIFAGDGDDVLVNGNGGEDIVTGGPGDDQLVAGGPRPDIVQGGDGDDTVKGNKGADTLLGGSGNDMIFGGPQPDDINGGDGDDDCNGGTEPDTFTDCEIVTE